MKRSAVRVLLAMDTAAAVYLLVMTVVFAGRGRGVSVPDSVALVFMAMSFVVVGGLLALRRPATPWGGCCWPWARSGPCRWPRS
jgi:hypothetical protein